MAIDELHVSGELAFMRSYIRVRVSPPGTGVAVERAGYTLSLFRKVQGRWLLARDANLLTIVPTLTGRDAPRLSAEQRAPLLQQLAQHAAVTAGDLQAVAAEREIRPV